jgi:hypothetical protein
MWPEAGHLFNTFYGMPSPVLYKYNDDEGQACVRVIWSQEDTRMGCVLGSMGFDITMEYFVYNVQTPEGTLQKDCPHGSD